MASPDTNFGSNTPKQRLGSSKPPLGPGVVSGTKENPRSNRQPTNAQLLFEPKPPEKGTRTRSNRSPSPGIRRRAQSAKAAPSSHQARLAHTASPAGRSVNARRPLSAVVSGTKTGVSAQRPAQQFTAEHVLVPRKFLQFDDSVAAPCANRQCQTLCRDQQLEQQGAQRLDVQQIFHRGGGELRNRGATSECENLRTFVYSGDTAVSLPQGIAALAPWLTPDLPVELTGVKVDSCLAFLPSLRYEAEGLPTVPPQQDGQDVLFHKPRPLQPKPFDPKKLFHYDVEKNLPAHMKNPEDLHSQHRPETSRQGKIFSLDGQLLHDQSKYSRNRTLQMVQQEIEDLQMLLEGVGREGSSNVLVQYQYEVNMLRDAVRDTVIKCHLMRKPKTKEEDPPDIMGLRAFIREREQVLARIKARREACLVELRKLEESLGLSFAASK